MTLKKTSQAQAAKTKLDRNRELVLVLLEWDELTLGDLVMSSAVEYLKRQCGPDVYGQQLLLEKQLFWAWWRMHWAKRDDVFIAQWADSNCLEEVREEYRHLHSAVNLNMRPHRIIMDTSFMDMVQFITKGDAI